MMYVLLKHLNGALYFHYQNALRPLYLHVENLKFNFDILRSLTVLLEYFD